MSFQFYIILLCLYYIILIKVIILQNLLVTIKNSFEGDYHGLSGKTFFKLNSEGNDNLLKIAVASHTPLHRSLEGLDSSIRKKFNVIGQNYENADYIYNNISEVNSRLNKKYNIPGNFVKVYELNIQGVKIYEIFKKLK